MRFGSATRGRNASLRAFATAVLRSDLASARYCPSRTRSSQTHVRRNTAVTSERMFLGAFVKASGTRERIRSIRNARGSDSDVKLLNSHSSPVIEATAKVEHVRFPFDCCSKQGITYRSR